MTRRRIRDILDIYYDTSTSMFCLSIVLFIVAAIFAAFKDPMNDTFGLIGIGIFVCAFYFFAYTSYIDSENQKKK